MHFKTTMPGHPPRCWCADCAELHCRTVEALRGRPAGGRGEPWASARYDGKPVKARTTSAKD